MQILTRRKVLTTPPVLLLNTAITLEAHKDLWSTPGWLPDEIGIIFDNHQFFCYEGEDLKLHLQRGVHNIRVYSLIGVAVNVENGESQRPHFVAVINGKPGPLLGYILG
jgi:PAB-dependent poly(A)-specific ribonuclease subunit 2